MNKISELYRQLREGEKATLALWVIPVVGLIILVGLPFVLTRPGPEIFNYTNTGQIGDTIGGIAGPVIAVFAALLTFLAFWIQFQANKAQTAQFLKQAIDTRFYELLKLHRDNVNEIHIEDEFYGRKAFVVMFKEFKFAYHMLKLQYAALNENHMLTRTLSEDDFVNIAFIFFFMGVGETSNKLTQELVNSYEMPLIVSYVDTLQKAQGIHEKEGKIAVDTGILNEQFFELDVKYKPFNGHISRLGHYFRHLFQTVKFVAEQDDHVIQNKYEYLKTVRAQLSSHEQLLLYYNALTILGKPWIDNGYFTDYRMIKNLPLPLADFGVKPKEKLGERNSMGKLLFEWDEIKGAV